MIRHFYSFLFGSFICVIGYWVTLIANAKIHLSAARRLSSFSSFRDSPLDATPILYLTGDETMAHGGLIPADLSHGYGEYLHEYLSLPIRNHAISGATSRKFIRDGHWERLAWHLRPNDVVLFAFGARDEGDSTTEAYFLGHTYQSDDIEATIETHNETVHTYSHYMLQMLNRTISASAIPLITTAAHISRWDDKGNLWDGDWLCPTVYDPKLAQMTNTTLLDMYSATKRLYQDTGYEKSIVWNQGIDNWLAVNEQGARLWAEEWIKLLRCAKGSKGLEVLEPYFTAKAREVVLSC